MRSSKPQSSAKVVGVELVSCTDGAWPQRVSRVRKRASERLVRWARHAQCERQRGREQGQHERGGCECGSVQTDAQPAAFLNFIQRNLGGNSVAGYVNGYHLV
jgi:hypothetical protein